MRPSSDTVLPGSSSPGLPYQAGQNCSEFNGLYLTLDIFFWYIVGAILVSRFQKK